MQEPIDNPTVNAITTIRQAIGECPLEASYLDWLRKLLATSKTLNVHNSLLIEEAEEKLAAIEKAVGL